MLGIPEGSLRKRSYTGCPINLNFVVFIILQLLMWVTVGRFKLPVIRFSNGSLCLWWQRRRPAWLSGPAGLGVHGGHSVQTFSGRGNQLSPEWQQNPTVLGFSFNNKRFQAKGLAVLEYMTSCQSTARHVTSSLRSWGFGIYIVGKRLFCSRDK